MHLKRQMEFKMDKGISDLITKQGIVNLDFADIKSIMQNSGIAMLGFGEANGDEKLRVQQLRH